MREVAYNVIVVLVAIGRVISASSVHEGHQRRRQHHSLARITSVNETEVKLYPRGGDSKWTWYDTEESGNPGACGNYIKNYENAVAWPLSEFNFKEHCFKKLTIAFEGRTQVATVLDACGACPHKGLDLSRDLFKKIAPHGDGVVFGSWTWGESGGGSPPPPPPPPPPPSYHPPPTPKPTSSKKPAHQITSAKPKPTTSKAASTTSSAATPTSTSSKVTAASATITTTTSSASNATSASSSNAVPSGGNIAALNDVLVRMGELLLAAN